jgi:hypothetical protein
VEDRESDGGGEREEGRVEKRTVEVKGETRDEMTEERALEMEAVGDSALDRATLRMCWYASSCACS